VSVVQNVKQGDNTIIQRHRNQTSGVGNPTASTRYSSLQCHVLHSIPTTQHAVSAQQSRIVPKLCPAKYTVVGLRTNSRRRMA
jgi:hypothetical protein